MTIPTFVPLYAIKQQITYVCELLLIDPINILVAGGENEESDPYMDDVEIVSLGWATRKLVLLSVY